MSSNISEELKKTLQIIGGSESEPSTIPENYDSGDVVESRPTAVFEVQIIPSQVTKDEDKELSDVQKDYVFARNVTYTLIGMVGKSLAGALEVADDSQHPRAYSVVNELAETMRNLAQDLLALQKSHKDVTKGTQDEQKHQVVNNTQNNFNGSTTDIIKLAMQMQNQNVTEGVIVKEFADG